MASKYWLQITRSEDFWKLSCHEKWTTVLASDRKDFSGDEYLIPTLNGSFSVKSDRIRICLTPYFAVAGEKVIDWKFYYQLRYGYDAIIGQGINLKAGKIGANFGPGSFQLVAKTRACGNYATI